MSPEVQAKAFEPFFTTKDVGEGTGLGLSQVYGFVKQSRGHARIYSEVDQGTTIKIYLPRATGQGIVEPASLPPVEDVEGQPGETILIVEDDADVRGYLRDALRELRAFRILKRYGRTIVAAKHMALRIKWGPLCQNCGKDRLNSTSAL